jgi:hypothetical protein
MFMANPRFQKDGPKRRRRTRRETSPVSRQGWVCDGPKYKRAPDARLPKLADREV